ncbi:MAG TPA: family 78 glycoside hydrolase catalytic domain [Dysgonamonadaceae bacterium]|nr:family 78 glycoside hydrolase catalytic domain [Dysgonamonadaceae bacterium]
MKTKNILSIFLLIVSLSVFSNHSSSLVPEMLTCEYLTNPQGLDELHPRFSWKLLATDESAYGQKQTAYRILVSRTKKGLEKNRGDMWDTDWVSSDNMQLIAYEGNPLLSDQTYYWKVSVKDEEGNISPWSDVAQWGTGLFTQDEWTAKWIGTSQLFNPSQGNSNIDDPWMRKTIYLDDTPEKAMMYIASVGYHELYINGHKIGNHVLAPAVTDHTKRARYIAYDIAESLEKGENVIALWLGASWSIYAPYITADKPRTPIVIAQADVYNSNGQKITRIETGASWKTHASSNKLLGTWEMRNYGGEIYDANKEIENWNVADYDDTSWTSALIYTPKLQLSSQNVETNQLFKEIHPIDIEERFDGSYRIDMGVNFAGWTQINVLANPGDTVRFLFSEREQDDMTFNIHSAYVVDSSGKGTFRNRFNYSSGRWITIKGLKTKPQLSDIKGWEVRTAFDKTTTFECSDPLQNWIYDRVLWTFQNLSLGGYIVDCPQRERFGYGGDAHATSETGMFNYYLGAFYTKWLQDWRDVQGTEPMVGDMNNPEWAHKQEGSGRFFGNGVLPQTAPTYHGGGGPAWGGIVVTLPWFLYQHEGDIRVLETNFEMIKGWLAFLQTHTENNMLKRYGGSWDFLGDWLWPNATAEGMNNDKPETLFFNNCYWVYNLRTAAKIARIIGYTEEANEWEQQAEVASKAIHKKFYNEDDHSYADKSMANLAAALYGDVMPVELRQTIIDRLEKEILINKKGHIHVGITGGAMLFKVLRDAGRDDLMYSMTSQTTYPSWGYMRENDATTIWEMWEKDLPGHSLLHSSYLYPGAWYIDGMAGIRRGESVPGFRKFAIRIPKLTETQVSWAKASFNSPSGIIRSEWKRENGKITFNVTVPPNCTATIYFPDENRQDVKELTGYAKKIRKEKGYILFEVSAGQYRFSN